MPKQSLEDAHLHLHTKTLSLQEPIGSEEKVPEGIGSTIPHNFRPPPAVMGKLLDEADAATIHIEIQKFIFHHREQGTWSHDWESTFGKWWARFVEHQKKNAKPKAAPRIEVNAEPNWEWHVSRFAKNQSMWSKRSCGPEPGQIGCRAPREVLLAHHIDPATGHIIRETTP